MVRWARRAEEAGFDFVTVSDHFHPWTRAQGQSPFVWGAIGAIAAVTERVEVATCVTCPTVRIHPAIMAQAAATAAVQLDGRFVFGLGTGERLNETILGDPWPPAAIRREMLEEAVAIMRALWTGEMLRAHEGTHYTVHDARIFTLPDEPPPIVVSGFGPHSAALAGRIADGYWNTAPDTLDPPRGPRGGPPSPGRRPRRKSRPTARSTPASPRATPTPGASRTR